MNSSQRWLLLTADIPTSLRADISMEHVIFIPLNKSRLHFPSYDARRRTTSKESPQSFFIASFQVEGDLDSTLPFLLPPLLPFSPSFNKDIGT